MPQLRASPRRALLHSFYIGGRINFTAKQRFLGSLDAHHVLPLPRVHGHDQQRRGILLFTSCKGWSPLLKKKKARNPSLGGKEPFPSVSISGGAPRNKHPPPPFTPFSAASPRFPLVCFFFNLHPGYVTALFPSAHFCKERLTLPISSFNSGFWARDPFGPLLPPERATAKDLACRAAVQ